jgi:hypothetical protein
MPVDSSSIGAGGSADEHVGSFGVVVRNAARLVSGLQISLREKNTEVKPRTSCLLCGSKLLSIL